MTSSENNEIWKPQEYAAYHRMVFRVAFDFLNAHFPPQYDPEWWKQVAIDTSAASDKVKGGTLINGILLAISDYLEEEWKKRKEADL